MIFKIRIKRPYFGVIWERTYSAEAMIEAIELLAIYREANTPHKYTLIVEEAK